jgi:hypothetical protein
LSSAPLPSHKDKWVPANNIDIMEIISPHPELSG